ncbi:hypothetical protein ACFW5P_35175 [Streptomyces rochei]|uniref:hypothetical protein n=1 Tax=Streptomyces rochei TaxID=1928 RepID=UPI00369950E6
MKIHNSPAMQPERADIDLSKGAWGMRTENPWGVPNEDVGIASVYTSCEMFT